MYKKIDRKYKFQCLYMTHEFLKKNLDFFHKILLFFKFLQAFNYN